MYNLNDTSDDRHRVLIDLYSSSPSQVFRLFQKEVTRRSSIEDLRRLLHDLQWFDTYRDNILSNRTNIVKKELKEILKPNEDQFSTPPSISDEVHAAEFLSLEKPKEENRRLVDKVATNLMRLYEGHSKSELRDIAVYSICISLGLYFRANPELLEQIGQVRLFNTFLDQYYDFIVEVASGSGAIVSNSLKFLYLSKWNISSAIKLNTYLHSSVGKLGSVLLEVADPVVELFVNSIYNAYKTII